MDSDGHISEQLFSLNNLDPVGCERCDGDNVDIPSTLDVNLFLEEISADTMRIEISQGLADPGSSAQQPATVSPQDLELAPQLIDDRPVTSAPEEPAILAVVENIEDQPGRSNGVTGGSNMKDVELPAQPTESPAKFNLGCPTAIY